MLFIPVSAFTVAAWIYVSCAFWGRAVAGGAYEGEIRKRRGCRGTKRGARLMFTFYMRLGSQDRGGYVEERVSAFAFILALAETIVNIASWIAPPTPYHLHTEASAPAIWRTLAADSPRPVDAYSRARLVLLVLTRMTRTHRRCRPPCSTAGASHSMTMHSL